jgi:hypothetical protein
MDKWIACETVEEAVPTGECYFIFGFRFVKFPFIILFGRGARTSRHAHDVLPRVEESLCCSGPTEGGGIPML